MNKRLEALLAVMMISFAAPLWADVVATCSNPDGRAYYVPSEFIPASESGWKADSISKGSFQLIRVGDDWDISYTDATGDTRSSKGDGGKVLGSRTKAGDVVVQVLYAGNYETYVFWLSLEKPVMSMSQARFGSGFKKHSLMVAPCRVGR